VGRTVDVMRILLTYGLDIITGNMGNKACLNKTVKESVKKLLNEAVELDSKGPVSGTDKAAQRVPKGQSVVPTKQGDWNCPKYEGKTYLPCIMHPYNGIYVSSKQQ
jgi:ABC-type tungstate transport system permease subunit